MSLINDALKRASHAPRTPASSPLPAAWPGAVAKPPASPLAWLLPALAVVLALVAVGFISWAMLSRPARKPLVVASVPAPPPVAVAAPAAPVAPVTPPASPAASAPAKPSLSPEQLKLHGILYSATAPKAIINGQTVHPGDAFKQFRVKAIGPSAVTLIWSDGREIRLTLD